MGQTTEVGVHLDRDGHIQTPWGSYRVLESGPGYKVKSLIINPGQATSLQIHQHRDERWVVIEGVATVIRGEHRQSLGLGGTIFIPFGIMHRLQNVRPTPLHILEVQYGDYLSEDDIIRLEDRYGREASKH